VRGTGKSDKEGFYAAALWLHERHPKMLACNLPALAEFGYLKDFPELLYRLVHGADVRAVARARADAEKAAKIRLAQLADRRRRRAGVLLQAAPPALRAPTLADYVSAARPAPRAPTLADYVSAALPAPRAHARRLRVRRAHQHQEDQVQARQEGGRRGSGGD